MKIDLTRLFGGRRDDGVIDFAAIKAAKASISDDERDPGLGYSMARQLRWTVRALVYAEEALNTGTVGAFRKAARRVRQIYLRELRHDGMRRLAEALQAHADMLKERRRG